jgi:hypothetical protein
MWELFQTVLDRGHHVSLEFHLKSEAGYPRGWIVRVDHLVIATGRPTLSNAAEAVIEYARANKLTEA